MFNGPPRGPLKNGAGTRSRTRDLLITNQLLYQLSYAGTYWVFRRHPWRGCGALPSTGRDVLSRRSPDRSGASVCRLTQLSYAGNPGREAYPPTG